MAVIGKISKEVMDMIMAGAKLNTELEKNSGFDCGGETTLCEKDKKLKKKLSDDTVRK
jgi:hypothetical protein